METLLIYCMFNPFENPLEKEVVGTSEKPYSAEVFDEICYAKALSGVLQQIDFEKSNLLLLAVLIHVRPYTDCHIGF